MLLRLGEYVINMKKSLEKENLLWLNMKLLNEFHYR